MTVSLKSHKMLWGRAAGRCSNPNCRSDLFEDETETDDSTLIGENCHIVAEADDGPRGDADFPLERRNLYGNLILMCRNHHKVIDSQPNEYSVEVLHRMKRDHEEWVRDQLGLDGKKLRDDAYYASLIDTWAKMSHIEHWPAWSSHVLSGGQPVLSKQIDDDLANLRRWLLARVWPGRYIQIEASLQNFQLVLSDFQEQFRSDVERRPDGTLITRKFYKIDRWDDDLYRRLLGQYEWHVDLVQDLMLEMTRAANWVCDAIRQEFAPTYRLSEGRLVVQSGPQADLSFHEYVVQYSERELAGNMPFQGVETFIETRKDRDNHFGEGPKPI